ncbi:MAG: HD domain-containing phosphohydrolase [Eubacterium sp.]|nr:HD domain-containing phosphohydrolase [Eubacterium sp.]
MQEENKCLMEYFGSVFESGDLTSDGHCRRVRLCSELILDRFIQFFPEYGLTKKDREEISFAAVVHDVGKVAVPDWILQKPGRLSFEEFEIVKNHTRKGKKMFEQIMSSVKSDSESYDLYLCCAKVCMSHHERYDGEGYPEGLKGDAIPIAAQIVGLADAYDVLVSERIYKSAYSKEEAFDMILEGECGVFSPKLLQIFQMCRMEVENIYES